jgi:hypothetical protein
MTTRPRAGCQLLEAEDPRQDESYQQIVAPLGEVSLDRLLMGDEVVVADYVKSWRTARIRLLDHLRAEFPHVVLPPLTVEALDQEAIQAPFSPWVRATGESEDLALDLIARLRSVLADPAVARPLSPPSVDLESPSGHADAVDDAAVRRFYRQVVAALAGRGSMAAQIVDAFGLSKAELGRMFGVSRQAATGWLETDMPTDRKRKASVVLSIADLLSHRLKPGRLPGVARREAAAYGGLSMLDMIAADRHEELLDSVRTSFDFAKTA